MKQPRKPRSDSVLKNLPEHRQEAVIEYLREHNIKDTVAWLEGEKIKTSDTAVSEFRRWYEAKLGLERIAAASQQVVESYRRENPGAAQEELDAVGQLFFSRLAIDRQDNLDFKRMQDVRLRRLALDLATRRMELTEEKYRAEVKARKEEMKRQMAAAKGKGGITQATLEKIERELNLL